MSLLRTRVTSLNHYSELNRKLVEDDMLFLGLAQNVLVKPEGITGDFVLVSEGGEARYLADVKRLQEDRDCRCVVEVG